MAPAEEADIEAIINALSFLRRLKAITESISDTGSRQLEMSLVTFADFSVSN